MTGKSLYDILGVAPDATAAQIRDAYLLRSKVLHPDRFDQTRQAAEWRFANEMLKEINYAYSVVGDPVSRAEYDQAVARKFGQRPARQFPSPGQPLPRQVTKPPMSMERMGVLLVILGIVMDAYVPEFAEVLFFMGLLFTLPAWFR